MGAEDAAPSGSNIGDSQFPRSFALPRQSPIYWVVQKDRYLRQLLIRDIERTTERRLAVYFANRSVEAAGIDEGDVTYVTELLSDIGSEDPVDLLIETNGGTTDATEAVVSVLRNRLADFRAIVANGAKSNGTLICLAAKSILMGASSHLGPIDPNLDGTPCTILAMPQVEQSNFAAHHLASFALKQTQKLAKTLLLQGMMAGAEDKAAENAVRALASRDTYFSHGSAIDHREASELGLAIEYLAPESDLWQRIWLLYTMYEFDCRRDGYLKVFESGTRSTAIAAPERDC